MFNRLFYKFIGMSRNAPYVGKVDAFLMKFEYWRRFDAEGERIYAEKLRVARGKWNEELVNLIKEKGALTREEVRQKQTEFYERALASESFPSLLRTVIGLMVWVAKGMIPFYADKVSAVIIKLSAADESKRIKSLFSAVELTAYILPAKTRKECFAPSFEEAKDDYLQMRRKNRGKWARRWLAFCFTIHTVVIVSQSMCAMVSEKVKKVFWVALGGAVMWWRGH